MLLDFSIEKAIAAAAYLLEREGGKDSMFVILKKLYYADRMALIEWGKPITGDSFASMSKGPVVSGIYDLFKGKGLERNLNEWNAAIAKDGNSVSLRKPVDQGALSQREIELLEKSRQIINGIRGITIATWFHDNCPEWQDPHGSSVPIDPSTILRVAGKTEEEIKQAEEANDEIRLLHHLLATR